MTQLTRILPVVLATTLLASLVGVVSVAVFIFVATNPTNSFTTGTVVISTSPVESFIYNTNMAPGDKVTAPLTVINNGSLTLRYAVTSLADNPDGKGVRTQLRLTIWDEAQEGDPGTDCNSTPPGTVLYGPAVLGADPAINVIGNPLQGFQAGDRTLAASTSEVLCFQVQLLLSTGNAYQYAGTQAIFDFKAEQTANNP